MPIVSAVKPGSIADEAGIKSGDNIITVNDHHLRDIIDFRYLTADSQFQLEVTKQSGNKQQITINREYGQDLGIEFNKIVFDKLKTCTNNCLFCFVDQQPPGLRDTLNCKDDDYRFSFLQGSFITLSNLNRKEMNRIINLNLSPLYISVHTTNPRLRVKMMKNPRAGLINQQLRELADNGIQFHTQIVLCPGINDGRELDNTIDRLEQLYPSLLSLGLVPVGLTSHRSSKPPLHRYTPQTARQVLQQIEGWQQYLFSTYEQNWLYAADEFYFLARKEIPGHGHYQGFPQLENGIGVTRLFWHDFQEIKGALPDSVPETGLGIITGTLGQQALKPVVERLNKIKNLTIDIIPVTNKFFGKQVTVTGLLTAGDIIDNVQSGNYPRQLIIPGITLNDRNKFLDGINLQQFKNRLPSYQVSICNNIEEILEVVVDDKTSCSNSGKTQCR